MSDRFCTAYFKANNDAEAEGSLIGLKLKLVSLRFAGPFLPTQIFGSIIASTPALEPIYIL
jgi:hypothetical protein